MKLILIYTFLALLPIASPDAGRVFQESKPAQTKKARGAQPSETACVNKSGEKLENKDDEIKAFMEIVDLFTTQLVREIESAENTLEGIEAAQKFIAARKPALRAQSVMLYNLLPCQLSKEVREKMHESFLRSDLRISRLPTKYASNAAVRMKLRKLGRDYLNIFDETDEAPSHLEEPEETAKRAATPCQSTDASGKAIRRDDEINSFVDVINTFTDELVERVESASTPLIGVEEAQKYMDERKIEVRAMYDSVKNIGECQVSEETRKNLQNSFYQDGVKVGQLTARYGSDPELREKLQKLTQDFLELLKI